MDEGRRYSRLEVEDNLDSRLRKKVRLMLRSPAMRVETKECD